MPLGINYTLPILDCTLLVHFKRNLPLERSFGPTYLRKCLGSNRKHIEGGYSNAVAGDCERDNRRFQPKTSQSEFLHTLGDNKGIAGATSSAVGSARCLVRRKGKFSSRIYLLLYSVRITSANSWNTRNRTRSCFRRKGGLIGEIEGKYLLLLMKFCNVRFLQKFLATK